MPFMYHPERVSDPPLKGVTAAVKLKDEPENEA
jgi:hypothetical protein